MKAIKNFFKLEASGGIILAITALLALIIENSQFSYLYDKFLNVPFTVALGDWSLHKPLLLWINDGLMAIFFLLVSLEIKREISEGELASKEQIILPAVAALGGLLCPALVYSLINWGDATALKGWAIPAATDIAFALGVMSILGSRVPKELKICLVAIAILDDIAAIAIIAVFYTKDLSMLSLVFALLAMIVLILLNKLEVKKISAYILVGIVLWVCVLKSGVHATLAGVVVGMFIPIKQNADGKSLLKQLEHDLHPWVAYGVLPIFAFANAGVPLIGLSLDMLQNPITLGIILGLSIGAPSGVLIFTYASKAIGLIKLPKGIGFIQYVGMALLTGIGFTMSLFIGTLAFDDIASQNSVRLGVIFGSVISAILGSAVLILSSKKKPLS